MKWILIILGILIALVALVAIVGALLPKAHVASRTVRLNAPPERVWQAITDVQSFASWRGVKSAEVLPARDGHRVWREVDEHGQAITFEVVDELAPRRLVTKIADRDLPFGGSWTYELVPADAGTQLTITENGEVYNPIFRFVSRFVMGHHATIDAYIAALTRKVS